MTDDFILAQNLDTTPILVDTYPEPELLFQGRFIECKGGIANKNDYSFHFLSRNDKKYLNANAIKIIQKHLSNEIPERIQVEIFLPDPEWTTDVITILIKNANFTWSFEPNICNQHAVNAAKELESYILKQSRH
jgi:hypothetical protein